MLISTSLWGLRTVLVHPKCYMSATCCDFLFLSSQLKCHLFEESFLGQVILWFTFIIPGIIIVQQQTAFICFISTASMRCQDTFRIKTVSILYIPSDCRGAYYNTLSIGLMLSKCLLISIYLYQNIQWSLQKHFHVGHFTDEEAGLSGALSNSIGL